MTSSSIKSPSAYDAVHKTECALSHDTPFCPSGLAINLKTFTATGDLFVDADHERTNCDLYLRTRSFYVPKKKSDDNKDKGEQQQPKKVAIGTPDGFDAGDDAANVVDVNTLLVYPSKVEILLPNANLPELVLNVVDAVLKHDGVAKREDLAAWAEENEVKESRYAANLPQEDPNGRLISPDPKKWKCMESGATENLWLNLSDGFIGSGRRNWDGSGGNGAAIRHYEEMKAQGKDYPLAVKLGTITPNGADVFSYAPDENDLVTDANLKDHLSHWGIDIMKQTKTDKTMAELTLDLNQSFEFDKVTEAGKDLQAVSGAGRIGLSNLGNSCYIASILQLLASIDDVAAPNMAMAASLRASVPASSEATADELVQFAKAMEALRGDRYAGVNANAAPPEDGATPTPTPLRIAPRLFRTLLGQGHSEFSSARQQDALEYLGHLIDRMESAERSGASRIEASGASGLGWRPLKQLFEFEVEERLFDPESQTVRYTRRPELYLGVNVPLDRAVNSSEVAASDPEAAKRRKLEEAGACTYVSSDGTATDNAAAAAPPAPDAAMDTEMVPAKVVPRVPLLSCIDSFAATEIVEFNSPAMDGKQVNAQKSTRFATFPPYMLVAIHRYYFDKNWRPAKLDAEVEAPAELNLESLRAHGIRDGEVPMPDAPEGSGAAPASTRFSPDADIIAQIVAMGFEENGAKKACKATNNSGVEAAMEWVLSHMGDADFHTPYVEEEEEAATAQPAGGASRFSPDADIIAQIVAMGFEENGAKKACKATNNSGVEAAMEWVLSHMGDADFHTPYVEEEEEAAPSASASTAVTREDGPGIYELVGFVSHVGANTACGHYVCHARRTESPPVAGASTLGPWLLFNDEKVALSQETPVDRGYVYLYRRRASS
ncbi:ubiquitin carboxyl-terminal hydrolase [Pseudoscourfieldia marina]